METNKYYTPLIEEFHVGLDYEMWNYDEEIYQKYTMEFPDFYYPVVINQIKDSKLRVKYLDKEDIESLGWEYVYIDTFTLRHWTLQWNGFVNLRGISISIEDDDTETFFQGYIKNISELEILMNQLGI